MCEAKIYSRKYGDGRNQKHQFQDKKSYVIYSWHFNFDIQAKLSSILPKIIAEFIFCSFEFIICCKEGILFGNFCHMHQEEIFFTSRQGDIRFIRHDDISSFMPDIFPDMVEVDQV